MTGFSADWLSLREPADRDARPPQLIEWLRPALQSEADLRVLDLATGTGSNLRYLAPRIGGLQQWTLADHDPVLLAALPTQLERWTRQQSIALTGEADVFHLQGRELGCRVATLQIDLARDLEAIDFSQSDLVTTAALLDLVSDAWLDGLARRCAAARCVVLFALSYDGRIDFTPVEPEDARIRELVNLHQRMDKGFGPALGPEAATRVVALLHTLGYEVASVGSDWHIDALQPQLQSELITGWAAAATEMAPEAALQIAEWRARRLALVATQSSTLIVGHKDIAARPAGRTAGPLPFNAT